MSMLNIPVETFYSMQQDYLSNYSYPSTSSTRSTSTSSTSTSTDTPVYGDDDGKIGLGHVIQYIGLGAINSVVDGVKGMIFNSDGKISPGKIALTAVAGAACIAFPAIGLAACGLGIASGGAKLATGVFTAVTADTDAEAIEAWKQVGEGGLTLGTSILGAKSSLNAVKTSSTAGISSVDDAQSAIKNVADKLDDADDILKQLDNVDDVADAAKIMSKVKSVDTSALGNLDDGAGMTQKALALAKDMGSSTKNNWNILKADALTELDNIKEVQNKKSKLKELNNSDEGKTLQETESTLKKAQDTLKGADESTENYKEGKKAVDDLQTAVDNLSDASGIKDAKAELTTAKNNTLLGKIKNNISSKFKSLLADFKDQKEYSSLKKSYNKLQKITDKLDDALQEYGGDDNAYKRLIDADDTLNDLAAIMAEYEEEQSTISKLGSALSGLTKDKNGLDAEGILETAINVTSNTLSKVTGTAKKVLTFLSKEDGTYAEAVQKFGYENVLKALETFTAMQISGESV